MRAMYSYVCSFVFVGDKIICSACTQQIAEKRQKGAKKRMSQLLSYWCYTMHVVVITIECGGEFLVHSSLQWSGR